MGRVIDSRKERYQNVAFTVGDYPRRANG